MPLTEEQLNALAVVRAMYDNDLTHPSGTIESLDERARYPDPASLTADVTVRVEIAPPSPYSHPFLPINLLKAPERVPIYFYVLRNDQIETESDRGSQEVADTHVIFFIHGGGNVAGHPTHPPFVHLYIQLLRAVAAQSGDVRKCVLIAPAYRLATAPENAFPAALQDLVAAYDFILDKGYKASNIVIGGDSAGGNHAVVLTHLVLQSERPSPRGVVAIAPFHSYDQMSDYAKAQAKKDIIDAYWFKVATDAYLSDSGVACTDPLVSGTFVPLTPSWPKTLILVGTADQIIDASRELGKRLSAQNLPVELVEYEDRPHGWWSLAHIFPDDIQDAAQRISRFVLH